MRKSKFARSRLAVAAGLGTGAVTAALLVAPNAAFAAISLSKPVAAPGDTVTLTDDVTSATPFTASTKIELQSASCNAKYVAASTSAVPATTTAPGGASATVTFTVPPATAGTNGTVKKWYVCAYDGSTAATSLLQGSNTAYTLTVGYVPTLSSTTGITGGGDSVTITPQASYPVFTGVTTIGAVFNTADCTATYATPTTGTTSTVTKNTDGSATLTTPSGVSSTTGLLTAYNICLYNGTATSSALISQAAYNVGQLSLSQNTGPYGGLNGLNITSPNMFLAGNDTPGVNITSSACAGTYADLGTTGSAGGSTLTGGQSVASSKIRKLTDSRLAVTVPALFTNAPNSATTWNICVYANQSGGALIASVPYTLTTVPSATAISPKAGPALGGSKIIVSGTALPIETGKITATLGGTALTNIVPISATAFSAITPQHAPANNVALVLTTDAGSFTLSNAFSFTAALKVSPNTAPNTKAIDLVVNGVGFQSASWGNTLLTGSHIVLTRGTYDPSANASSNRANPPIAECGNPLVLSDTEVICTLDLTQRLASTGAGYVAAVAPATISGTIGTTAGSRVLVDSATGFTDALVGTTVTSPNVPAGTTVLRYIDTGTVLISNNATGTGTTGNATFSSPLVRTITTTTTSAASTALAANALTPLLKADEGRFLVSATSLVGGQKLLTYTSGTAGVLSANASGGPTTESTQVLSATLPVPDGAYNLIYVSNTAVGANGSDVTYIQSMISSGSTFTVSSF
ncbi:hypothetical protein GCM10010172_19750 [Paractinoplanes ferrugineus]|uniref:IPT/TIG domain-containing protein n=1 Tax=Paractinoplanes ferrugineus TaxID=113564 RepID=A0A919J2A3_9ACTN|nr:IPT/TIG domain-containing protein [Actinoplanes ferrugineus]GIE12082.1 hypothetical protein Afe05nite_39220 [Actinoplanes ferrugineus]